MEVAGPSSLQELAVKRLKSLGEKIVDFVVDKSLLTCGDNIETSSFKAHLEETFDKDNALVQDEEINIGKQK